LIVRKTLAEDHDPLGGNFIFANVFAVAATAHLDNHKDLAELALDGHIPQPDNVIGEKRNRVGTEWEFGKRLIYLNRA
jgi:hypothetical protein